MTRQSANGMKISNKYLRLTSREGLKGQVTALEPKRKKKKKKKKSKEKVQRESWAEKRKKKKKKKKKEEEEEPRRQRESRERRKKKGRRRRRREQRKLTMVVTDFFFFFFFFFSVIYSCRPKLVYRPKLAGMTETRRNGPKFFPRWNKGVSRSGLHTGTRFSGRSGRNGTVFTTRLVKIRVSTYIKKKIIIIV
jgi:hypothetical protein